MSTTKDVEDLAYVKILAYVDTRDFWSAVFGSGFETWSWWRNVEYLDAADWDTPGRVTLTIDDPDDDNDATITKTIDVALVVSAYCESIAGGDCDTCTGNRIHWEDLDACASDVILQRAVLGKVVYA